MTTFDSLPQELVDLVTDNLDEHQDILNLSSTCKFARQHVAHRAFEHLRFTSADRSERSASLAAKVYGHHVKSISWVANLSHYNDAYWNRDEYWDILSGKLTPQAIKISVEFNCKHFSCKNTRSMAPYSGLMCWLLNEKHNVDTCEQSDTTSFAWLHLAHTLWNVLASNSVVRQLHIGKLLMEFCCRYDSTYTRLARDRYGESFPLNALLQRLDSFSLQYYIDPDKRGDIDLFKPFLRDIFLNRLTNTTSLALSQLRTAPKVATSEVLELLQDPTPAIEVMLPALTSLHLNRIMLSPNLIHFLGAHRHQLLDLEMTDCYSQLASMVGPLRPRGLQWYQILDAISGHVHSNAHCALRKFTCGPANIYRWERPELQDDILRQRFQEDVLQLARETGRRVFDYTLQRQGAAMEANLPWMGTALHWGNDQKSYDVLMQIVKDNVANSA